MDNNSNSGRTHLAPGKAVRMGRVMGMDGRVVIVAIDHGICGVHELDALAKPAQLIKQISAAGADCILASPGTIRSFAASIGRVGLIMRIDGGPTLATGRWNNIRPMLKVEDALRMGADGVVVMGLVGTEAEEDSLRYLAAVAAECDRLGMVLIAEMLPGGLDATEICVEQLAVAARVGAELGADIVKIAYRGPPEEFRGVTSDCYRPVVVLGGPKRDDGDFLGDLNDAMEAGAAGVAVGRNVWSADQPAEVTTKLANIVHSAASKSP